MALQQQDDFYQIGFHFNENVKYSFACLLDKSDEIKSEKTVTFIDYESYTLTYKKSSIIRFYSTQCPKNPKKIIETSKIGDYMCLSGKFYEDGKSKKVYKYFYFKKDFNLFNEILSLQHKKGNENVQIFLEIENLPPP